MFSRLTKLLGLKDDASSIVSEGKNLLTKAKAAIDDIKQDGIWLDDITKAKSHFDNLKGEATNLVSKTKQTVQKVKNNSKNTVSTATSTTKKTW